MPHAIIRGGNGRRHEVDFEGAEIRIEVYFSEETVVSSLKQSTTSRLRSAAGLRSSICQSIFFRRRWARRRSGREPQDCGGHTGRPTKTRATAPGV